MRDLVVIGCGRRKGKLSAPARLLYTGVTFFGQARRYVESQVGLDYFILSAKHGLVRPTDIIAPYNVLMGQPGTISTQELRGQIASLKSSHGADRIIALCAKPYVDALKAAAPEIPVLAPLAGKGIGMMILAFYESWKGNVRLWT